MQWKRDSISNYNHDRGLYDVNAPVMRSSAIQNCEGNAQCLEQRVLRRLSENSFCNLLVTLLKYLLKAIIMPLYFVCYGVPKWIFLKIQPIASKIISHVKKYCKLVTRNVSQFLAKLIPSKQRIINSLKIDIAAKKLSTLNLRSKSLPQFHQKSKIVASRVKEAHRAFHSLLAQGMKVGIAIFRLLPKKMSIMVSEMIQEIKLKFPFK